MPMEALHEDGSIDLSATRPIFEVASRGYSNFRSHDVVMAKVTPCFENGKSALVPRLRTRVAYGTTEVTVLRSSRNLEPRFLSYLVREQSFRDGAIASMTGAGGLQRVSEQFVRDFAFARPPRDEQREIADYLDRETGQIDALIAKQHQLIETLTERRGRSVDHHLLQSKAPGIRPLRNKYLYRVRDEWAGERQLPLLSVSIHHGVRRRDESTSDEPRANDLTGYKIVRQGDIVLNRMRAFQGASGESHVDGIVSPDYLVLSPNPTVSSSWFAAIFKSSWMVGEMTSRLRGIGSTESGMIRTPRINSEDLGAIIVNVPPLKDQMSALYSLRDEFDRLDRLAETVQSAIVLLRERRQALISAAVTGNIDVRGL